MNSGQQSEILKAEARRASLSFSSRSAEVLLAFLILVSLYIVAAYDYVISVVLKLFRPRNARPSYPANFDTTHLSRSVARRVQTRN